MNLCMRDSVLDIPLSSCLGIFSKNPTKRIIRCRKKWSSSCVASRQVAFLFRTPKKSLTVFFFAYRLSGRLLVFLYKVFFWWELRAVSVVGSPGYIPIPKSINPERVLLNMADGFDLKKSQMEPWWKNCRNFGTFFFWVFGVFFVFCWV